MSAEAYRDEEMYREDEPEVINVRRNPYLVDYEQERRLRERRGRRPTRRVQPEGWEQEAQGGTRRPTRRVQPEGWEQESSRDFQRERPSQREQLSDWGQEIRREARQPQESWTSPRQVQEPLGTRRQPQPSPRGMQGEQLSDWGQEIRRASRQPQESRTSPRQVQEPLGTRRQPQPSQRAVQRELAAWGQEGYREPRQLQEIQRVSRQPQAARRSAQAEAGRAEAPRIQRDRNSVGAVRQQAAREPRRAPRTQEEQERRAAVERRRAAARRRRVVKLQRMMLFTGIFCVVLLCGILLMKRMDTEATGSNDIKQPVKTDVDSDKPGNALPSTTQGLDAKVFAAHPEWEENFLTPNEYSRPGDALEEVKNIFVHYTANPNTSAAQNRSYFEQLKDTHITSASAHFIIGYNGEIIQCIPLDEIAYAVQTRNFDSVSIECCYKAADGSFTQETYDSLIELLAWLTDAYDLTPEDILRHYDCGGKKCPIYYTENEDAWEILKRDVAEKL